MKRRAWVAAWVALAIAIPGCLALFITTVWTGDDRFAGIGGVLAIPLLVATAAMGMWSSESKPPPNLPRADRKRLRDEERRMALEKVIRDAERDLGLDR